MKLSVILSSVNEQVELLESRGMVIGDKSRAKKMTVFMTVSFAFSLL